MERFEDEFITWHHKTPVGVKIDEVFGMDSKTGKVWIEMAKQIFFEQGGDNYRVIDHFPNGAPFIDGYPGRISVSHTTNFFVVASLPKTPETNLEVFSTRAAMGVDAEKLDRTQVIKIREKFLSDQEMDLISEDDLTANIIAWTAKEALYKTALTPGLDFRSSIIIKQLPTIDLNTEKCETPELGKAIIELPSDNGVTQHEMNLYSYESYGCCVTIAYSPKCARFGKH